MTKWLFYGIGIDVIGDGRPLLGNGIYSKRRDVQERVGGPTGKSG